MGLFGVLLIASGSIYAQASSSVTPEEEYRKNIRIQEDVQPLGDNPFGEEIGLYAGSLSFEQTDVSLEGIGPTLSLSRTFRLPQQQEHIEVLDNAFGSWDLDLPRITTITANQNDVKGWVVANASKAICSSFSAPPSVPGPAGDTLRGPWAPSQWWHGYQMVGPGIGSQELLKRRSGNSLQPTISGMSFPIVTKQHWQISCLAQAENDSSTEAFLAIAPDGTKYWFNHLAYRYMPSVTRALGSVPLPATSAASASMAGTETDMTHGGIPGGVMPLAAPIDFIARREASMLVTRIEDRFGNFLTYTYDSSNRLTSIAGSDGRALSVNYGGTTPLIQSITLQPNSGAPRTWTYNYGQGVWGASSKELTSVQLPNGSSWQFSLAALGGNAWVDLTDVSSICNSPSVPRNLTTTYSGSITHPSGLVGTFTVKPVKHGRSYVPRQCWNGAGGSTAPTYPGTFAVIPAAWYDMSIVSRSYSGAGLGTQNWQYNYSAANESWLVDSCATTNTCASTIYTDQVNPDGSTVRTVFSNRYNVTEGQNLETDYYIGASTGTAIRRLLSTYADPGSGPWPASLGVNTQTNLNDAPTEQITPLKARQIVDQGDIYTWVATGFDAYGNATQTSQYSSIAGQAALQESSSYAYNTDVWVLGLLSALTNTASGEVIQQNIYDTRALLAERWSFGRKVMSYGYDSAGNLSSFTDGNGKTTGLSNYKRGIPQSISYPDGTHQSINVDDFGQITAITDQRNATTGYAYDAMGRLTQITYPGGDEVAWTPKQLRYEFIGGTERGIAGGHWRRTSWTGNAYAVTYYDALLRPVLVDTFDAANGATHTNVRTDYDWRGQKTFVSYAAGGAPDLGGLSTGNHSTYDGLGRLVQAQQDSELGTLTSTTTYLSGARIQVTDPKGNATTTTYQVFDTPTFDKPVRVEAPAGITQTIARNVYGEVQSINQTGAYGTEVANLTKYWYYDAYHRLCRRTEPESGSEVIDYDGADNIAWSVQGLSINGSGCGRDQVSDAAKTKRTYDAMNRVLTIAPPAGTQSTTYTYDELGHTKSANSGISSWAAYYNLRGLMTGETLWLTGQNAWGLGYAYNANGSLTSIHYPGADEYVSYAPDAFGRPTQVGSYASGVSYFPDGAVQSFTFGNGTQYLAQQNMRHGLSNFTYGRSGALQLSEDLTYDANGNITSLNDLVDGQRSKTFSYDSLNRLTQAAAGRLWGAETYTYDALNNLRTRLTGGTTYSFNFDTTNRLVSVSTPAGVINTFAYDLRGNVRQNNDVTMGFDQLNHLVNIPGYGSYYYDANGRRVRKDSGRGISYYFYSSGGQLMYQWDPATTKATNYIYLGKQLIARNETVTSQITGNIDGVGADGSGTPIIYGWACSTGIAQSIDVHLYVGGAAGTGVMVGSYSANKSSEAGVAQACGVSGGNYRFEIPISLATRQQYGGKAIYVHGISPVGNANLTVANSGNLTIPLVPNANSQITGNIDGVGADGSGTPVIYGWACSTGIAQPIDVHLYVGGAAGTGVMVGSYTANKSSEAGLAQPCGVSGGNYRFEIPISLATRQQYGGKAIYIHGISPVGNANLTIANSGSFTIPAAPNAPATPASINAAVAGDASAINVSWNSSSGATSYVLQQQTNGGGWSQVLNGNTASYSLGSPPDGSYTYRVQACSANGCSGFATSSTVQVAHIPGTTTWITVPGSSNTGAYTISWGAVGYATSYILEESANGGGWATIYTGAATSTGRNVGNGTYSYRVKACNANGCGGYGASGPVGVTLPPSTAPSVSVPGSSNTGSYTVSWSGVSGATSYTLQEQVNGGGWTTVQANGATSWAAAGKSSSTYAYQVQACNAGGCAAWSSPASTVVTVLPATPSRPSLSLTGTSNKRVINLSWPAVAGATTYKVEQTDPVEGTAVTISGPDVTYKILALNKGQYKFRVQACNASGCSDWSPYASTTI